MKKSIVAVLILMIALSFVFTSCKSENGGETTTSEITSAAENTTAGETTTQEEKPVTDDLRWKSGDMDNFSMSGLTAPEGGEVYVYSCLYKGYKNADNELIIAIKNMTGAAYEAFCAEIAAKSGAQLTSGSVADNNAVYKNAAYTYSVSFTEKKTDTYEKDSIVLTVTAA